MKKHRRIFTHKNSNNRITLVIKLQRGRGSDPFAPLPAPSARACVPNISPSHRSGPFPLPFGLHFFAWSCLPCYLGILYLISFLDFLIPKFLPPSHLPSCSCNISFKPEMMACSLAIFLFRQTSNLFL